MSEASRITATLSVVQTIILVRTSYDADREGYVNRFAHMSIWPMDSMWPVSVVKLFETDMTMDLIMNQWRTEVWQTPDA